MSAYKQQVGGSAVSQNALVAPARVITIDTDNHNIRVHDGLTPGGHVILNQEASDTRYQRVNSELTGVANLAPDLVGILVRVGPADYRARKFIADSDAFTLTNPAGFGGDIQLSLKPTIAGDHTWSGAHTFAATLTAEAGIEGDVTGNLTGDSEGTHTGGVDARGAVLQFDAEQIPSVAVEGLDDAYAALTALSEATPDLTPVPIGGIIMWNGSSSAVPAGWSLCNGTNGTPDLRDKFILAAGGAYNAGDTGGATNHVHVTTIQAGGGHTHTATCGQTALTVGQMPTHSHLSARSGVSNATLTSTAALSGERSAGGDTQYILMGNEAAANVGKTSNEGGGGGHNHAVTVDATPAHTHDATTAATTTLPPYYAIAFIMRIN